MYIYYGITCTHVYVSMSILYFEKLRCNTQAFFKKR